MHSKRLPVCLAVFALAASSASLSPASLVFSGSSDDWFDPGNWADESGNPAGRIPGVGDDVLVDGETVRMRNGSSSVASLLLKGFLGLEESSLVVGELGVEPSDEGFGFSRSGVLFNPSSIAATSLVAPTSGDASMFLWNLGLGGTAPASAGNTGAGRYGTLEISGDASLFGTLDLSLFHGFVPAHGDEFTVVSVGGTASGTFANAGEGELVERFGDVGLFISYRGGDGNDVSLAARTIPEPGTAVLLGLALFHVGAGRRRRSCPG